MASFFCSTNASRSQFVKLVFPGGHVELLDRPVMATEVMAQHPRFCVARPDVFRQPAGAVASPDTMLQLGHKYYVVPKSTVRRLLKHSSSSHGPGGRGGGVSLRRHLASSGGGHHERGCKVGGRKWFIRCLWGGEAGPQRPHDDGLSRGSNSEEVRDVHVKTTKSGGKQAPNGGSPARRRRRLASPSPGDSASYSWQPSLHSITEE